jgi:predicted TIM-barrel fold metal-dependent hydrolase
LKIDVFNHFFPGAFYRKMLEVAPNHPNIGERVRNIPTLTDLDQRFRVMDEFGDYGQILSLASPPLEALAPPEVSPTLAQIANDEMAELVNKYSDRVPGFTASLPMNNPDAMAKEIDRSIKELGARGVQVFSNVEGRPLDEPEFSILWESLAGYDLPVWIHPARGPGFPDYLTEEKSKYEIWWTLGWPYETSVTMARLVFSGLFDRFPNLKIITHHMGAMIPYFEGRVGAGWDQLGTRTSDEDLGALLKTLKKRPLDYFKQFYADTALFGSLSGTKCGLDFFGVDHVLFASDFPFDPEAGMYIRDTIRIIEQLEISEQAKDQIFQGNARQLLKLSNH